MSYPRRNPRAVLALLLALALLAPTLALAPPTRAANCTVTSLGDGGTGGTLREALLNPTCSAFAITGRPALSRSGPSFCAYTAA